MSETPKRLALSLILVPAAAVAGFLIVGNISASMTSSGSALADGATVAIFGLGAALLAAGGAGFAVVRSSLPNLVKLTALALVLAAAGWFWARHRRAERIAERAAAESAREVNQPERIVPTRDVVPIEPSRADVPTVDSVIGMLTWPGLGYGSRSFGDHLELLSEPVEGAPVQAVIEKVESATSEEIGYEEPALVVYGEHEQWVRVRTSDQIPGWARKPAGAKVIPLPELVPNRLNYLGVAWDRLLFDEPTGSATALSQFGPEVREVSAAVHDGRIVDDQLWWRVTVFNDEHCSGTSTDRDTAGTGWIPAWIGSKRTAWFYSRGC